MKLRKGNNDIRLAWRKWQVEKYGEQEWLNMYRKCKSRSLLKDEIYMV